MSVRRATPTDRRWVDAARGGGGLVGILLLAVGIPIALISWVGWPLPAEMPTLDEVSTALSTADISDQFLIKSLALVCWFVWVELMTSLMVEAVAHARGKEAGRVPFGGGMQRTAARLIATVALLGALTTAKGAPEAAELVLQPLTSGSPSADLMVQEDEAEGGQAESAAVQEAEKPSLPVYEVQPRDTLWGIAEDHLHDPFRWPEIFEMNKGKAQPDGRTLSDPDLIQPGWQLDMPADAVGLGDPDAAEPDTSPEDSGPDVNDEPDPEPEPEPDDGDGRGSGDERARGGMTVLDDGRAAPNVEYAAPEEGMVLLPDDSGAGQSESVAPGIGIPGLGPDDELASPGSQPWHGAYAEPTDDRQG